MQFWTENGFCEYLTPLNLGDSYEYIHKSVYQLSHPFGRSDRPAFPLCRTLQHADFQRGENDRSWRVQNMPKRWYKWLFSKRDQALTYHIPEARYHDTERVLLTIWLDQALRNAQDNATEVDSEPQTVIPLLQSVLSQALEGDEGFSFIGAGYILT